MIVIGLVPLQDSPVPRCSPHYPQRQARTLICAIRLQWRDGLPGAALANMGASPSMCTLMSYSVTPVGFMRSCFKEKFAIPRQPLLAPAARGVLELVPPFDRAVAVEGLERISHVWLLFLFHQALEDKPRLKVRPPRLGGNATLGVFASRATYRPNGIGQSVVKLDRVEPGRLWLSGIDLLDGTPVLDIKPYVPYADQVPDAFNRIADAPPVAVPVEWSDSALDQAQVHAQRLGEPLVELIEQCLAQDPRPAYQVPEPERRYGVLLWDVQVRWHYPEPGRIRVLEVVPG